MLKLINIFAFLRTGGKSSPQDATLSHADMPVWVAPPEDWPAVYDQLDVQYGLAQRGVNCYLFLRNPGPNAYWIKFFFDNQELFTDRVGLHFFINHDPEHIVKVLRENNRKPFVSELMCSSQVAQISDTASALIQPERCKQLRDIAFKNGRYIQPVNRHRYNPRFKKAHG